MIKELIYAFHVAISGIEVNDMQKFYVNPLQNVLLNVE